MTKPAPKSQPPVWAPLSQSRLLAVQLPIGQQVIPSQQAYLKLLAARLGWLIRHYLKYFEVTTRQVEQMLDNAAQALEPGQFTPHLTDRFQQPRPEAVWIADWTQALVQDNQTIHLKLVLQNVTFPCHPLTDPADIEAVQQMFKDKPDLDPNLEDWLFSLTCTPEM